MTDSTPLPENQAEPEPSASENPALQTEVAYVNNSMAGSVTAPQDAEVNNSMVGAVAAGRDMTASNSFGSMVAVGRDLHLEQGCGLVVVVGNQAQVEGSTIGLLVAKSDATLTNSQILMTTRQAIALGAAFGAVFAVFSALLCRKKRA